MKAIYRLLIGSTLFGFSFAASVVVLCLVGFNIASSWILLPIMPLALILFFLSAAIIHKARFDYDLVCTNGDFFMAESLIEQINEIFIEPFKRIYCLYFSSYEEDMIDEWSLQEQMETCDKSLTDTDEFSDSYSANYESPYLKRGSICVRKMNEEVVGLPVLHVHPNHTF